MRLTGFVAKGMSERCCRVARAAGERGANTGLEIEPDFAQQRIANVAHDGSRPRQPIPLHELAP